MTATTDGTPAPQDAAPTSTPLLSGVSTTLGPALLTKIQTCRILLVGAGGIGCELLKNLALSGFRHVEVIDLDTIDVSNLNRQFLFRSEHVGMPKCTVGAAAGEAMAPLPAVATNANDGGENKGTDESSGGEGGGGGVEYLAHHGNVCDNSKFNVQFLSKFALVLNALDNVTARRRVNRLCLAAKVPLIEAGTTGYLGQVTVIDKPSGVECYECQTKPTQKVYPICTIRSTPSQPVHCIVWAKEFYKLLFADKVEESMLFEDQNVGGEADNEGKEDEKKEGDGANDGDDDEEENTGPSTYMDLVEELRTLLKSPDSTEESIRSKAAEALTALYATEITKQIDMGRYKTAQKVPKPLTAAEMTAEAVPPTRRSGYQHTDVMSKQDCTSELVSCLVDAAKALRSGATIPPAFDKDDDLAMRFVAASANLRQYVFGIDPIQSHYSAKGIAGNIIPAIATTNAIVAGLQVLQAFHILEEQLKNGGKADGKLKECCRYTYCLRDKTRKGYYLQPTALAAPNPKCFVCRSATVDVALDTSAWTMETLLRRIIKGELGFAEPTILIGGDLVYEEGDGAEEDYVCNLPKTLKGLPAGGIGHGTVVRVEDFTQDLEVDLCFSNKTEWDEKQGEEKDAEERFVIGGDKPVAAKKEETPAATSSGEASAEKAAEAEEDDDDDEIEVFDAPDIIAKEGEVPKMRNGVSPSKKKRPLEETSDNEAPKKKKSNVVADVEIIELE